MEINLREVYAAWTHCWLFLDVWILIVVVGLALGGIYAERSRLLGCGGGGDGGGKRFAAMLKRDTLLSWVGWAVPL